MAVAIPVSSREAPISVTDVVRLAGRMLDGIGLAKKDAKGLGRLVEDQKLKQ